MINAKTTNWCCRSVGDRAEWARRRPPRPRRRRGAGEALGAARLRPAPRRARSGRRVGASARSAARGRAPSSIAHRFDALRFEGPGTELTVGLLPTSRFAGDAPGMQTVDGIVHARTFRPKRSSRPPTRLRADGVVTATKPLDVGGTVVRDLRVRFEGGRAVEIERTTAPRRCGRASRRTRAQRGSARSRSSTAKAGSARPARSSSTRCSTRTPQATSRSGMPMRSRSARRIGTASTRARSTSTS